MNGKQEQTDSARSVEERIAEWERQKVAVYRLHERDIANLVESYRSVSTIATHLGNLIQRIAGAYTPAESDLERDAKGYAWWIRHEFERVWGLKPDELFTQAG